jgi:NADH:ubiquinone oxidoreductase subunit
MFRWLRRLPAAFGQSKQLVGRDSNGNKYYNLVLEARTARIVETPGDEEDYDPSQLPVEWRGKLSAFVCSGN